jgi:hypothetical protein
VPGATFTTLESLEHQAAGCERVGSALYGALLRGLAADHLAGGVTAELLDGVSERPLHDAVPLRYLATAHRLALAGTAPDLAAVYPSCGGVWSGQDITDIFLSTVANNRGEFINGLQRSVQTNEVGRAVALVAGFSLIAERHRTRALRTLEVGASAGLLSRWPSFHYDTGESSTGDPDSPVRFGRDWFAEGHLPSLVAGLSAVERAACDISPIDATSQDGRLTMLSFLWPDQVERFDRLQAALAVASDDPVTVDAADAGDWLSERLSPAVASSISGQVATVVFHSIVWQYLPAATKDAMRAALAEAGRRTTADRPLCWLRFEPANAEHAALRLTTWAGGTTVGGTDGPAGIDELLANVGYHGTNVSWRASRS